MKFKTRDSLCGFASQSLKQRRQFVLVPWPTNSDMTHYQSCRAAKDDTIYCLMKVSKEIREDNICFLRYVEPIIAMRLILIYSAFAGSGSLLLMRGFQIFAKRKCNFFFTIIKHYHSPK